MATTTSRSSVEVSRGEAVKLPPQHHQEEDAAREEVVLPSASGTAEAEDEEEKDEEELMDEEEKDEEGMRMTTERMPVTMSVEAPPRQQLGRQRSQFVLFSCDTISGCRYYYSLKGLSHEK